MTKSGLVGKCHHNKGVVLTRIVFFCVIFIAYNFSNCVTCVVLMAGTLQFILITNEKWKAM